MFHQYALPRPPLARRKGYRERERVLKGRRALYHHRYCTGDFLYIFTERCFWCLVLDGVGIVPDGKICLPFMMDVFNYVELRHHAAT